MKKGIISLMMMLPVSALANQTLITEVEAGNLWLQASYASSSVNADAKSQGISISSDSDTDELGVKVLKAFNTTGGVIPILSLSLENNDSDDESVNVYNVGIGAKVNVDETSNVIVFADYKASSDDATRSAMEASVLFGKQTSSFYNEISLSASLPKNTSDTEGGNSVDIVNAIKVSPVKNLVLIGSLGISLTSDIKHGDNYTLSYGPTFGFGLGAEVYLNKELSIAASLAKGFGSADAEISDVDVEIDVDGTVAQISLNARF
jgi:hypothetical protein